MNVNIPYLTTNFFLYLFTVQNVQAPQVSSLFEKEIGFWVTLPVYTLASQFCLPVTFFLILQRNDSVLSTESYLSYRMTGKNIRNLYVNPFSIESQKLYQASNYLTDTDVSRPISISGWKVNSSHFRTWDHSEYIKHVQLN